MEIIQPKWISLSQNPLVWKDKDLGRADLVPSPWSWPPLTDILSLTIWVLPKFCCPSPEKCIFSSVKLWKCIFHFAPLLSSSQPCLVTQLPLQMPYKSAFSIMENSVDSSPAPAVWISWEKVSFFDKYNLSALLCNPTLGLAIKKTKNKNHNRPFTDNIWTGITSLKPGNIFHIEALMSQKEPQQSETKTHKKLILCNF